MKKTGDRADRTAEPRAEYDFSGGERGRYAERFGAGTTVVILEPEVAKAFPDSAAVNAALRELLRQRESSSA